MTKQLPWLKYSAEVDRQIARHSAGQDQIATVTPLPQRPAASETINRLERHNSSAPVARTHVSSGRQEKDPSRMKRYIYVLLKQLKEHNKPVWDQASPWWNQNADTLSYEEIKRTVDSLKAHLAGPRVQTPVETERPTAPRDNFTDVPDGYYAITREDKPLLFVRVTTWDSGQRKVQIQASDDLHRTFPGTAQTILESIRTQGPQKAGILYGQEIGKCCACGRTLTDETSRSLGIGPDCRTKERW